MDHPDLLGSPQEIAELWTASSLTVDVHVIPRVSGRAQETYEAVKSVFGENR